MYKHIQEKLQYICISNVIQMGFRSKSLDLYRSVSHCINLRYSNNMYFEYLNSTTVSKCIDYKFGKKKRKIKPAGKSLDKQEFCHSDPNLFTKILNLKKVF